MNFLKRFFIIASIAYTSSLYIYPIIVPIKSINEVGQYFDLESLTPKDIVLFDLDNTVIHFAVDNAFSDHGLTKHLIPYIVEQQKKFLGVELLDDEESLISKAYDLALPHFYAYQKDSPKYYPVKPVETDIVEFINKLKEKGVPVVGLTSRDPYISKPTIRQLDSIGISFSKLYPEKESFNIEGLPPVRDSLYPAQYYKGVFFCGENNKENVLAIIFTTLPKYQRALFFDDRERTVSKVGEVVESNGIEYYGFYYRYLEERVADFRLDPNMIPESINLSMSFSKEVPQASEQLKPLASIWSDIEKGKILGENLKKASFVTDCVRLSDENKKIKPLAHDGKILRIASYNVHLWADPYFEYHTKKSEISGELASICISEDIAPSTKVTPIFDVIRNLDADILVLQEAASDNLKEFEDYKKILKALGYHYGIEVFGNMNKDRVVPYGPFGNWIISKYPFIEDPKVTYFTHQSIPANTEDYVDRCFINAKIKLANGDRLSIYGTHLDVFDATEGIRIKQIQELVENIDQDPSDYILIVGDLNSVRQQDYASNIWSLIVEENKKRQEPTPTLVLDYLQSYGFVDCFTKKGIQGPKFTTWSGTTIDYVLVKSNKKDLVIDDCAVYYNAASDHIPVLMDINNQ